MGLAGRQPAMISLLAVLARLVARAPALVVAAWLALAGLGLLLAPALEGRLVHAAAPPPGSDSARAADAIARAFPSLAGEFHLVVVAAATPGVTPAGVVGAATPGVTPAGVLGAATPGPPPGAVAEGAAALRTRLAALPAVRRVQPLGAPADGTLLVATDAGPAAVQAVPALRAEIARAALPPGVVAEVTGATAASVDLVGRIRDRLATIERVGLLASGIVFLGVFGGLGPAALALAAGGVALAILPLIQLALAAFMPVTALNVVVSALTALALGLDYPLFFLHRLREEDVGDAPAAASRATTTAGAAILASAAAIATASGAMALVPLPDVRTAALAMALAAGLAAAIALTFLPACHLLARRLRPAPRPVGAAAARFWRGAASAVADRPRLALGASLALLLLIASPLVGLRTWTPTISIVPPDLEARRALDRLTAAGRGGAASPLLVVWAAEAPGGALTPAALARQRATAEAIAADPRIARVEGLATLPGAPRVLASLATSPLGAPMRERLGVSPDGRFALLRVLTRPAPDAPDADDLVATLRARLALLPPGPGAPLVGGAAAARADLEAVFARAIPGVAAFNVLAVGLLLGLWLRSVALPIKALVVNALPVLAGLGATVAVSQWGWGAPWLAVAGIGRVQAFTVVVVSTFLFAVSLDYEIFLLSRIKEAYEATGDTREAVVEGLGRAGRVIGGAALVLLSAFLPCLFVDVPGLQELGVALVTAILLDATVVRLVLAPAAVVLLGRWNFGAPRPNC